MAAMVTHRITMFSIALLAVASSAHAADPIAPDLCAEPVRTVTGEVYSDNEGQTISRFCDPRIDPPVLDADVCCSIGDTASCRFPDQNGRCAKGMKFWCEYGESSGSIDAVECYQRGPSTCTEGHCKPGSSYTGHGAIFDDSSWVCCVGEGDEDDECVYVGESGGDPPPGVSCAGTLTICSWGATNEDGTVDCLY